MKVKIKRNHVEGLNDARDYYDGQIGEAIESDENRQIIKVKFEDGCSMYFTYGEVIKVE